jgi:hypothetical protein
MSPNSDQTGLELMRTAFVSWYDAGMKTNKESRLQ